METSRSVTLSHCKTHSAPAVISDDLDDLTILMTSHQQTLVQSAWQQQRGAGPLSSVSAEQPPQPTTPPTLSAVIERMPQHSDTPPKKAARVLRALREAEKSRVEPSRTWASHTPPSPRGPLSPCVRLCAAVRRPAAAAAAATCVDEPPVSHQYHTPPPLTASLPPSLSLSRSVFLPLLLLCAAGPHCDRTEEEEEEAADRRGASQIRSGEETRIQKTLNQRRGVRARREEEEEKREEAEHRGSSREISERKTTNDAVLETSPPSPPGPGPILRCVAAKAARRHHEGPYGGTAKCKMKFSSFFSIHVGLHVPSPPPPPPPPPPAPVAAAASRPRRLFSAASGGERSGEERRRG
ncbi:hypothetical protein INR49_006551, partial [Caranx melampygus]